MLSFGNIIYPTLDLYLYDLRNGLGEDLSEIQDNRNLFQAKLPEKLHTILFNKDTAFEAKYDPLLDPPISKFGGNDGYIERCYYPVRLSDTYGLLFNCSSTNQTDPLPVNFVKTLKDYIERELKGQAATLGQTWMISGELPNESNQSPRELAKLCYSYLIPNGNWDEDLSKGGEGRLHGGYVFELWNYELTMPERSINLKTEKPPLLTQIQKNIHVIIALYPDKKSAKKAVTYVTDWMTLFSYRSKIMWSYGQSRYLKELINQDFICINQSIQEMELASRKKVDLKKIQSILGQAQRTQSMYTMHGAKFQYQIKTIEVNLKNYNKRLHTIRQQLLNNTPSLIFLPTHANNNCTDLNFLDKFSKIVQEQYLVQTQVDYDNFTPGSQLLEGLMNSIESLRVLVETDQAQRDRAFQHQVAIWGTALAVGSIVASVSEQFPIVVVPTVAATEENDAKQHLLSPYLLDMGVTDPWLTPAISTVMTILTTAIVALFIRGMLYLFDRQ
ncbi:hypothetical protein PMG71_04595 [Roseofilum sp. BLCC_M154]|uniref:Uncharacterized protein n=1 Tax=Roseofilum acuticapitatum BLCC-M154 TaxID=3022444 RepID=A0ABT7ARI9_9CYAN|nr:hypothetical protein [Roseofilum acuticapitatum]MDJ1168698.1 hypothetical protein [Roseofilum acuticapitatum BLCC-M154]